MCDDIDKNIKGWIKEAYVDANKLVNYDGVKSNINWNSAAALEYLGPSGMFLQSTKVETGELTTSVL